MNRALRAFTAALAYFTVLPVRVADAGPLDAEALAYWPLTGAVVGALAGIAGLLAASRVPQLGAPAALIAAIALTGALHVDGFLDCCDALFATAAPSRRLEILRDPRHGSFAIAGMAIAAVAWLRGIELVAVAWLPLVLAFAAIAGRLAALANAWTFPYARADVPPAFRRRPPAAPVLAALALAAVLALALGPAAVGVLAAAIGAGIGLGWFASRRLGGGLTGDAYGAIAVTIEIAALLALAALPHAAGS